MTRNWLLCIAVVGLFAISQFACSSNKSGTPKIDIASASSINIRLQPVFNQIVFDFPIAMVQEKNSRNYWYVVERAGKIYRVPYGDSETTAKELYLDLTSKVVTTSEGGLFSLAFHPEYANNHYVYVSYTRGAVEGSASSFISYVSRFTEDVDSRVIDPASEVQILQLDQPFFNHNGGHIVFGADNFLYVGFGDGGSGGDPFEHGQNRNTLLGSLMRIDIDSKNDPYQIPLDNPFIGQPGREEIYAYGLRNPWRYSFDLETGSLWLADVGQNTVEEVDIIISGGNYGWNCLEGSFNFEPQNCDSRDEVISPVAQYGRTEGVSITGGYVYRGSLMPELVGDYLFGDFSSGNIWHLKATDDRQYSRFLLLNSQHSIVSFAESIEKEIYVIDFYSGRIFRIQGANT